MSSPREATPCNGIVELNQRVVGPIRLPEKQPEHFLKHFNEVYLELGLRIAPNPAFVIAPPAPSQEAVSVVSVGSNLPMAPLPSAMSSPFGAQRSSIVEHLTGTLREALEGPGNITYFLDHDHPSGLFADLFQLSGEQAHLTYCGESIAMQVQHLAFAMDVAARAIRGDRSPVDWSVSWQCHGEDQAHWHAIKQRLASAYRCLVDSIRAINVHDDLSLQTAVGTIAHVSYHTGAIRQIQNAVRNSIA